MTLLLLASGILLGGSVLTYVVASLVIYVRLNRIGKGPRFSMLSIPGYITRFCRKEGLNSNPKLLKPLSVIKISQPVMIGSIVLFGFVVMKAGGDPN